MQAANSTMVAERAMLEGEKAALEREKSKLAKDKAKMEAELKMLKKSRNDELVQLGQALADDRPKPRRQESSAEADSLRNTIQELREERDAWREKAAQAQKKAEKAWQKAPQEQSADVEAMREQLQTAAQTIVELREANVELRESADALAVVTERQADDLRKLGRYGSASRSASQSAGLSPIGGKKGSRPWETIGREF